MSFATLSRNRNTDRVLALIAILAMVMSVMVILAPPARAHHPNISADEQCDPSLEIAYTATAWSTGTGSHRENDQVDIHYRVNDAGPWIYVTTGQFTEANSYSFSGEFAVAASAGDSVVVRALAVVPWGSGQGGGESRTTEVDITLDCTESATVTVSHASCVLVEGIAEGVVQVSINPHGGADVQVTGPGYDQTFTGVGWTDFSLTPGSYGWEATANEGYELTGDTEGTFEIIPCGQITVEKIVNDFAPEYAETEFGFTVTFPEAFGEYEVGGSLPFTLVHEQTTGGYGPEGVYEIVEDVLPPGWTFDSVVCVGAGDDYGSGSGVAIDLENGDVVHCTFYNNPPETPAPPVPGVSNECVDGGYRVTVMNLDDDDSMYVEISHNPTVADTLAPGESISMVIPAGETWNVDVWLSDDKEEKILNNTGTAEDCTEVLPTSITSPAPTPPPSVSPSTVETLPFTGIASGQAAGLALALIASGLLLATFARGRREDA